MAERNNRLEECIEIYKRSWLDEEVNFSGEHYQFSNLSMDPKPAQDPRPPIMFGATTPAGARRAARCADGLYPMFLDPLATPDRFSNLQDEVRRELDSASRDPAEFRMLVTKAVNVAEKTGDVAILSKLIEQPRGPVVELHPHIEDGYLQAGLRERVRAGHRGRSRPDDAYVLIHQSASPTVERRPAQDT